MISIIIRQVTFSLSFSFPSLSDARLFNIAVDTDKKRQLELELQVFVTGNEEKSGKPGNSCYCKINTFYHNHNHYNFLKCDWCINCSILH